MRVKFIKRLIKNQYVLRYELLQNQLVIKSARTIDTGSYSCVAKNNPGTKKTEFYIQVEGKWILELKILYYQVLQWS